VLCSVSWINYYTLCTILQSALRTLTERNCDIAGRKDRNLKVRNVVKFYNNTTILEKKLCVDKGLEILVLQEDLQISGGKSNKKISSEMDYEYKPK